MAEGMTHRRLSSLAVSWLRRPASRSGPGCMVAVAETRNWINGEIPDAIGWRPYGHGTGGSVLVEVKVSRADFLADAEKPHRRDPSLGMGAYRYYMAPEGVIGMEDLPLKWGLIEVNARMQLKVRAGHVLLNRGERDTWRHEHDKNAEISTLALCLNRVGDPQKLQESLRGMGNQLARMARRNEELTARNEALSWEVFSLRNQVGQETAPLPIKVRPRSPHRP